MTNPTPDREMKKITQIEPVESWGKHALDLRIGDKWVHFHTDYLCVVKQMRDAIESALSAAVARLAELEQENEILREWIKEHAAREAAEELFAPFLEERRKIKKEREGNP